MPRRAVGRQPQERRRGARSPEELLSDGLSLTPTPDLDGGRPVDDALQLGEELLQEQFQSVAVMDRQVKKALDALPEKEGREFSVQSKNYGLVELLLPPIFDGQGDKITEVCEGALLLPENEADVREAFGSAALADVPQDFLVEFYLAVMQEHPKLVDDSRTRPEVHTVPLGNLTAKVCVKDHDLPSLARALGST